MTDFQVYKKGELRPGTLPKTITAENAKSLYKSLLAEYGEMNILDGEVIDIPTKDCFIAPNVMKCRDYDPDYAEDLKNSFYGHSSLNFEKRVCFLVPMRFDESMASNS
jgi:hypothetical protein